MAIQIIFGASMTLIGGFMLYQDFSKRIKCKELTQGTVVDFREKTKKENGREKIVRYPIFEYVANGTSIRANYNMRSKAHPYELSDVVDIYYNKNKTDEFYIKGNGDSIVLGVIVLGMGLLLFLA